MSQQNLEVMRSLYEGWQAAPRGVFDEELTGALLDPDFELHPDPDAYWVGVNETYRGPGGLAKYMAAIYEAFDDYTPEVERFLEAGDKVVTLAIERARGRDSGAEVQQARTAHVWTLREGRPVRLDLYLDRRRALDELGLSE